MLLCVWPAAPCHPGQAAPAQPATTTMRFGCGITHSFSATALAASSIAVKAGERPLLGGGLPAGQAAEQDSSPPSDVRNI
jgi:hypothetical protein